MKVYTTLGFGANIDNLFSATVAGDLGASVVGIATNKQSEAIGYGTAATVAELVGDVDGFILGEKLAGAVLRGKPLSELLEDYYCGSDLSRRGPYTSAQRFQAFSDLVNRAELFDQCDRFSTDYYYYKKGFWHGARAELRPITKYVFDKFELWRSNKLALEATRRLAAQARYQQFRSGS
jgi:hypothetical protein